MSKIVYVEKENGGVASALNAGIEVMSGEYFAWLSHDDLFHKDKIKKQVQAIEKSGDKMKICSMNYSFFDDIEKTYIKTDFHKYYAEDRIENSIFLLLWGELHFSSLLFAKEHFNRVGLFNEKLLTAQDNDFIFRLLRGQKILFLEDVGSYVRLHESSGTSQNKNVVNEENSKLYRSMCESLSEKELEDISGNADLTKDKFAAIIASMSSVEISDFGINCKESNYVLVGAGGYGRRLNYEMISAGIKPKKFLDNDSKKDGKLIDGTICKLLDMENISPEDQLIITNKYYYPLENQLKAMGIKNYLKKVEIDEVIMNSYRF
jgi:hypothetical protein